MSIKELDANFGKTTEVTEVKVLQLDDEINIYSSLEVIKKEPDDMADRGNNESGKKSPVRKR